MFYKSLTNGRPEGKDVRLNSEGDVPAVTAWERQDAREREQGGPEEKCDASRRRVARATLRTRLTHFQTPVAAWLLHPSFSCCLPACLSPCHPSCLSLCLPPWHLIASLLVCMSVYPPLRSSIISCTPSASVQPLGSSSCLLPCLLPCPLVFLLSYPIPCRFKCSRVHLFSVLSISSLTTCQLAGVASSAQMLVNFINDSPDTLIKRIIIK